MTLGRVQALCHAHQVIPELVLEVGTGQVFIPLFVQIAEIARVSPVAAQKMLGGTFEHENLRTCLLCGHRGAERGIASANDQYVEGLGQVESITATGSHDNHLESFWIRKDISTMFITTSIICERNLLRLKGSILERT
jgi:hypothetical protein